MGEKSLDAIEGEGGNYLRTTLAVVDEDGSEGTALTYVVSDPKDGLRTSQAYVQHILDGLIEAEVPPRYIAYVKGRVVKNNPELKGWVATYRAGNSP